MLPILAHHPIERVFLDAFLILAVFYLAIQVRKPAKWVGRPVLWVMNLSHSSLTDWGLRHVQVEDDFTILDVGCGGGRTIQKLAALAPHGRVYGVDFAAGSVAASRAKNAHAIREGRVEIIRASVSRLPFPDGMFDLVTAVETQYYWPDPAQDMKEILRVLKPGGSLIVIAESYRKKSPGKLLNALRNLLTFSRLDVDAHRELFSSAGYTGIQVFETEAKDWISVTGQRPA